MDIGGSRVSVPNVLPFATPATSATRPCHNPTADRTDLRRTSSFDR
jgi:hypothetical protein